jgi:hypothetical protein
MLSDTRSRLARAPEQNFPRDARELHAEVMESATLEVWQSCGSISREELAALALPDGWRKIGVGRGAMDAHCFRRSPGADEDGPVRLRQIDGREFFFCARPASAPELPAGEGGPTLLTVDKHHTIVFEADRSVDWLTLPDGREFVHVVAAESGAPELVLPDGWKVAPRPIERELVIELPAPATVFFFPNGDSFQGPLEG